MIIKPSNYLQCKKEGCSDILRDNFMVPDLEVDTEKIKAIMIAEVPPENPYDYFYANTDGSYMKTTLQAFRDAGAEVDTILDILNMGIYITTAVKCAKVGYGIPTATVKYCKDILAEELKMFPNLQVYMLMGDVAIKAMNYIVKEETKKSVIPSGSTYKIRYNNYYYHGKRVIPSYLMTGGNYLIEKSKRVMIAQDIREMLGIMNDRK
ncbi:uracil-DNA glycosylase family protein [Lutispora saccharofermentans]|uniref:Uracil-DNA glycosylase n=1 Tax=Lutispora saccharofermentans TaxID=3024236 RepID=A0ABT1NKM1_9FIRM|nr:hypothetical protein [Lutispora saccharofermentans]MCQ1531139.1 hypothetical protein [Lutispora saccharofermentans]